MSDDEDVDDLMASKRQRIPVDDDFGDNYVLQDDRLTIIEQYEKEDEEEEEGEDDEFDVIDQFPVDDNILASIRTQTETLMDRSLATYIQQHCPTEIGKVPALMYINGRDTTPLNDNHIAVTQMCCITIPATAMIAGASLFGEFDTSTDVGRMAFRTFQFVRMALCDPCIGIDPQYGSVYENPRAATLGIQFGTQKAAPKVMPVVEPLFKRHCHMEMRPDHRGIMVPTYTRAYTKGEMFAAANVLGYRVWFFVTDPTIKMTDAFLRRIARNNMEMGYDRDYNMVSADDPQMLQYCDDYLDENTVKLQAFVEGRNTRAQKANKENAKRRELFALRRATSRPEDLIGFEFGKVSDIYNLIRVWENRCLKCKSSLICADCVAKPPAEDAIIHAMTHGPHLMQVYEAECIIAQENGFEPPIVPDITVTQRNAKFAPLPPSNLTAQMIDGSIFSTDDTYKGILTEFIDPEYYLVHTSPTALSILSGMGVCPEQLDASRYTDMGSRSHAPVKFAFPDYLFTFSSVDFFKSSFTDVRLPWVFDPYTLFAQCVIEVGTKANIESSRLRHCEFYNGITGITAKTILRAAEDASRTIMSTIPDQPPQELRGQQYTEQDQVFSMSFMPFPDKFAENEENSVSVENELRTGALKMVDKINLLKQCVPFIDQETSQHMLRMLRAQGMRELKRLMVPNSKTTYITHTAASTLLALSRRGKSAYSPIERVAHNLDSSYADFLGHLYFYFEALGMLQNHRILLQLLFAVYRASHCPITDHLFEHTTLLNNYILQGAPNTGKSHMVETILTQMVLPACVPKTSSCSARSANEARAIHGLMQHIDEMPPYMDPGKGNTDATITAQRSAFKELLTSHVLVHKVTKMNKDDRGVENTHDRRSESITTHSHIAYVINANDFSAIPGKEWSFCTRFTIYIINQPGIRYGAADLTCKSTPFQTSYINKVITSPLVSRNETMRVMHALHVAYAEGVALGAFAYPCIDMMSTHFSHVYGVMKTHIPSIMMNSRMAEQLTSCALTHTIQHALWLVFNSCWSPLIEFNSSNSTIKFAPFCLDQLSLVEPLTFLPEDAGISLIVQTFFDNYMPATNWEVALKIAEMFANFSLDNESGVEPEYHKVEINGVTNIRYDYLQCTGTIANILKGLNGIGVTDHNARLIIRMLATVDICCKSYGLMPAAVPTGVSSNVMAATVTARSTAQAPSKPVSMRVCVCVPPPLIANGANENAIFDASTLLINTHFLRKFSPEQITRMIIDACCHSGTRARTIAVNVTYPTLPFVMKCYDIAPNDRTINMDFSDKMDTHVRSSLVEDSYFSTRPTTASFSSSSSTSSLTNKGEERGRGKNKRGRTSAKRYEGDGVDIETMLCKQWLKTNVVSPLKPSYYTPKRVNRTIAERTAAMNNSQPVEYPGDILKKYTVVIHPPRYDTDEVDQMSFATDTGSSGIDASPDFRQLESLMNSLPAPITNYTTVNASTPYLFHNLAAESTPKPTSMARPTPSSSSSSSLMNDTE